MKLISFAFKTPW